MSINGDNAAFVDEDDDGDDTDDDDTMTINDDVAIDDDEVVVVNDDAQYARWLADALPLMCERHLKA